MKWGEEIENLVFGIEGISDCFENIDTLANLPCPDVFHISIHKICRSILQRLIHPIIDLSFIKEMLRNIIHPHRDREKHQVGQEFEELRDKKPHSCKQTAYQIQTDKYHKTNDINQKVKRGKDRENAKEKILSTKNIIPNNLYKMHLFTRTH